MQKEDMDDPINWLCAASLWSRIR